MLEHLSKRQSELLERRQELTDQIAEINVELVQISGQIDAHKKYGPPDAIKVYWTSGKDSGYYVENVTKKTLWIRHTDTGKTRRYHRSGKPYEYRHKEMIGMEKTFRGTPYEIDLLPMRGRVVAVK